MSTQYYTDLRPVFPDPETWTFAHVLRHWARERPDAVCLECPEEGFRITYADALAGAEVVASAYSTTRSPVGVKRSIDCVRWTASPLFCCASS